MVLKNKNTHQSENRPLIDLKIAREIGQTPQNFNKKLVRNTVSDGELSEILGKLNVVYEQRICFEDGTWVEVKNNGREC